MSLQGGHVRTCAQCTIFSTADTLSCCACCVLRLQPRGRLTADIDLLYTLQYTVSFQETLCVPQHAIYPGKRNLLRPSSCLTLSQHTRTDAFVHSAQITRLVSSKAMEAERPQAEEGQEQEAEAEQNYGVLSHNLEELTVRPSTLAEYAYIWKRSSVVQKQLVCDLTELSCTSLSCGYKCLPACLPAFATSHRQATAMVISSQIRYHCGIGAWYRGCRHQENEGCRVPHGRVNLADAYSRTDPGQGHERCQGG